MSYVLENAMWDRDEDREDDTKTQGANSEDKPPTEAKPSRSTIRFSASVEWGKETLGGVSVGTIVGAAIAGPAGAVVGAATVGVAAAVVGGVYLGRKAYNNRHSKE